MRNKTVLLLSVALVIVLCSCNKSKKVNKAEKQIEVKDLLGDWKMDSLIKNYSVLRFSPDSLIYVEHKHFRRPHFYYIDSINNIVFTVSDNSITLDKNKILYLDDSMLILNSILNIKEERVYKKFNRAGVELWHYKEIY